MKVKYRNVKGTADLEICDLEIQTPVTASVCSSQTPLSSAILTSYA